MLYAYSIPVALMTEGILWAGNTRDIFGDKEAGVRTMSNLMGQEKSMSVYTSIILLSYLAVLALVPLTGRYGVLLTLITIPIAKGVLDAFTQETLAGADERTAQLHLPFGLMMVFGVLLEAQIKAEPAISYWVWVICSFFGTLATVAILKFCQCKLAPSLDVDWGNYNVVGFDKLYGPAYGMSGKAMRYFVGTCELLGGPLTLACLWVDDPRAYFLSVGAMIGLGTLMAGALLTLGLLGKTPCKNTQVTAGQMGPAIFCVTVFWSVAATRFSLVPGPEAAAQYGGYNLQQIVLLFSAVCAFGLLIVAPLLHFAVGKREFAPELIAMDDYFFMNGNKWAGDVPDGFNEGDAELLREKKDDEEMGTETAE
jgi:hypothetical protein